MRDRSAIAVLAATAIAACSRLADTAGMPPAADNSFALQSAAVVYKEIYNFKGIPDGASPNGDLVYLNGVFYGSSYYGGAYGAGTVFRVTASGEERVLHSFYVSRSKKTDANPLGIALLRGALYGTTVSGGAYGSGTVFTMTTAGKERILHSLGYGRDGRVPYSGLLPWKGTLYGEAGGGVYGLGTVYSVTPTGQERVVCSFPSSVGPPTGGLIAVNGTLYGTSPNGGPYNAGTAFSLTTAGSVGVIHNFGASGDGSSPDGGVTALHGTLYGTTMSGGTYGRGIVFSLRRSGDEHVLHDFGSGTDGASPIGALAVRDGVLYGTTSSGGLYGKGTLFSMTTTGREKVLHNFGHASDGAQPAGKLLLLDGSFYSATVYGGNVCTGAGCGTVFELTPTRVIEFAR
jgi:uncharacterized repeat protein (TIGR03803 family)